MCRLYTYILPIDIDILIALLLLLLLRDQIVIETLGALDSFVRLGDGGLQPPYRRYFIAPIIFAVEMSTKRGIVLQAASTS